MPFPFACQRSKQLLQKRQKMLLHSQLCKILWSFKYLCAAEPITTKRSDTMKLIQSESIHVNFKLPFDSLPPPKENNQPVKFQVQSGGVTLLITLKASNYRKSWERGQSGEMVAIKGKLGPKNTVVNAGLQMMAGKQA